MKRTHRLILAGTAMLPILGAGGLIAHAATDTTKPQDTIIQKLVTKFNLNADEVQSVFDKAHSEREAVREAEVAQELTDAVTSGDLTQAQVDLITTKRAELKTQREASRDAWATLTEDERHAKMDEERTAVKAWAQENGIEA